MEPGNKRDAKEKEIRALHRHIINDLKEEERIVKRGEELNHTLQKFSVQRYGVDR